MNRLQALILPLAWPLALILVSGCPNSENEYNQLVEEKENLTREIEAAREESEVLNQALANIYAERDQLLNLLNSPAALLRPSSPPAGGAPPAGLAAGVVSTPSGKVHVAVRGDTLSNIASRYGTSIEVLRQLNPYLISRGNMVWEDDNIKLP